MGRVIIIAEGVTEEKFCKSILFPYLHAKGLYDISVSILPTKTAASGRRYKGGNIKSSNLLKFSKNYLRSAAVTTFIDYYGIDENFLGYQESLSLIPISEKKNCIEAALKKELPNHKFFPYIQMHEFEGVLFSDIDSFMWVEDNTEKIDTLKESTKIFSTPEHINNNRKTAPSKRIEKVYPTYGKTSDGILVAEAIGVDTIISKCPLFREWIEKIEEELKN